MDTACQKCKWNGRIPDDAVERVQRIVCPLCGETIELLTEPKKVKKSIKKLKGGDRS